jgi:putative Holliday junction resolvase
MRFMGLDFGSKFIGIAVSDEAGMIASPRESLRRAGLEKDIKYLTELARGEEVGEILVGMPFSLDGSEGPQAKKVMEFSHTLQERSGIQVRPWDERLTTVAAQRALVEGNVSRARRKQVVDKVAAALMLQSYLDYRNLKQASEEPADPEASQRENS